MPTVSVLMGTYNEPDRRQVGQAVESILGQTFPDFELLICDDGSEEGFYRWLRGLCAKDPRVRLLRNGRNHGLAYALDRCLPYATGEYIARMDADDISMPQRLERQVAFLERHKEYALVGCNAGLLAGGAIWGERKVEGRPGRLSFLHTSPFIHPSVVMRRGMVEALHGYSTARWALRVEDYELFMRAYAAGYEGCNLQETLYLYREDLQALRKRRYRYRVNECRVRYRGFRELGILKGNLRYVAKPLVAGLIPAWLVARHREKRYGIGRGAGAAGAKGAWKGTANGKAPHQGSPQMLGERCLRMRKGGKRHIG